MSGKLITIQVSSPRHSENSIGALVNLYFDEKGNCCSANRLVWFPKSECTLHEVSYQRSYFGKLIDAKKYFIDAPKWFLDKNNIKHEI
jgi:hypothetical protein